MTKPRIALPLGDPHGIGPEIALKAATDPAVQAACEPLLIGDGPVIAHYADKLRLDVPSGDKFAASPFAADGLRAPPAAGRVTAEAGRATVAYARTAIRLAQDGMVDAVVAAPHNETAVAAAGIPFSGYPSLVAQETGTPEGAVFLMLVSPEFRIVHVTLHVSLRQALDMITVDRVLTAIRAAHTTLISLGTAHPRIGIAGLNPHAGEDGLFGEEDRMVIAPAIAAARADGLSVDGPVGADLLLAGRAHDVYVVMLHDQGHIPIKLAGRGNSFGITIGAGILFSSVAHGSAHDIAGGGVADADPFINTVLHMARQLSHAPQLVEKESP
jgi:4-hydroxy-L-threonine phosphate dehydrogenase PdxA